MTLQEPEVGAQPAEPNHAQPITASAAQPKPERNVLGIVAFVASILGFILACVPGALIGGWILLPIAFILSIVALFMKGRGKGFGIAGLIISIVGTIVGVVVFLSLAATSFSDAFSDETTVSEVPAESEISGDEPDAGVGTRENPAAIGSAITSETWTVVVNAHTLDGSAAVAANGYNDPAPAGSHYEVVNYTVTYTGADSSYGAEVGIDLVTEAGNVLNSFDNFVILDDSMGLDELFNGASVTGSVAFLVTDGESAVIRVRPGMLADEVFVR